MPEIIHTRELTFEERSARLPEFTWHTSPRLRELVGSQFLQFDVRSLDSGKFSFPYHFHRAAEELFLILSGTATLRSPDGFQPVDEGDLLFFEAGPSGAHQLYNHSDAPCQYLDIRTATGIDVCEYPDSGKLLILPSRETFRKDDRADYYQGEEQVKEYWPPDILKRDDSAGE